MQRAETVLNNALPPQGSAPDITSQLRQRQRYHQRILRRRAVAHWWPCILLIILGGVTSAVAGQFVIDFPKYVFGVLGALVIFFLVSWREELGWYLTAFCATPFLPQALQIKSLRIYPAIPLLIWIFFTFLIRSGFRTRKAVLPSFWGIWPLYGMLALAVISNIVVQVTWTMGVPHKIDNTPLVFSELYAIAEFALPLVALVVTTAALTKHENWIEYFLNISLTVAVVLAVIVIIDFKRIGADINTFRFSEPKIGWMPLKAIAQALGLGCILAYARLLYATRWRMRIFYAVCGGLCLTAIYFTLQNSWWLEVVVALAVMTFAFSRRLFFICSVACIPLLPLVYAEIKKLQSVKSADFYRLIIWQDALRVWRKQPVLGVGPGNFWAYDQRFTQLPMFLRQFNKTGLGVAHNGYLQTLGELGPLGLFFYLAFIVVMIIICVQLFRRSNTPEKRGDRILGLIGLGLICGSALGDLTAGAFFLQPRQIGSADRLPQVIASWLVWGCVLYKDQLWRMAQRVVKIEK